MIAYLQDFIEYLKINRRYSERTVTLYKDAVERFYTYIMGYEGDGKVFGYEGDGRVFGTGGNGKVCEYEEDERIFGTGGDGRVFGSGGDGKVCEYEEDEKGLIAGLVKDIVKEEECRGSMLTLNNIRGFVAHNLKDGMSARSVNLLLSGLGSYCRFLLRRDILVSDPVAKIYRPKEKRRLPQFYTQDDIKLYLESPQGDDYGSMRNRTMVLMLYSTGMRRAEIAGLVLQNYDSSRKVIKITGKGSKEREIPVNGCLYEKIELYLQKRNSSFKDCKTDLFFLTDKGSPLYLSFVNRVVKKELMAFKEFGGKKSPHLLRHSLATHLLNDGAELNSIKEVLGHSSLAATQVYTHNSFEQLKKIYITAHPRAKKRR